MSSNARNASPAPRILVVRLSALGDIIHTLPAVASLRKGFPDARLSWLASRKWAWLLDGNPHVDEVIEFDRKSLSSVKGAWRELRGGGFDLCVDFQGLIQSALLAKLSGARAIWGFGAAELREKTAALAYTRRTGTTAAHVVDRNLELALSAGGAETAAEFPLPPGRPEGDLPEEPFVLASPMAGWASKQWPLERYSELGDILWTDLRMRLALNVPPGALPKVKHVAMHYSGLPGLIDATRRAAAVVGVDSGPLHIAAALGKPGVAIFGPTDPARNGPYGGTFETIRAPGAITPYKRGGEISPAMRAISAELVFKTLCALTTFRRPTPT